MTDKLDFSDIPERSGELENIIGQLLAEAKKQGATAAEAGVSASAGIAINSRKGDVETIEHTRDSGLGISVYFGDRKGSSNTSDLSPAAIKDAVSAACSIARYTSEDAANGLADASLMATEIPDLDLYHAWELTTKEAIDITLEMDSYAQAFDPRISQCEDNSFHTQSGLTVYGNSHGFIASYTGTRHSLSCSVIAEHKQQMERDYWYSGSRLPGKLLSPSSIAEEAARRTVSRLDAKKISTRHCPVIFSADISSGLIRSLCGAIRGASLYRDASFLNGKLDHQIFPEFFDLHENPLLKQGNASAAFDNEGVATTEKDIIKNGILNSYLLDSYSARKLNMQTTGHAGAIHNLSTTSNGGSLADLLKEMDTGILLTELMGQGANTVTGDYSRGATGFWVENGEIQYPINEFTIAGNLSEMFRNIQLIGDDIDDRGSIHTGSWLIDNMTIAGS